MAKAEAQDHTSHESMKPNVKTSLLIPLNFGDKLWRLKILYLLGILLEAMSQLYTLWNIHNMSNKLIMLSPIGIPDWPPDFTFGNKMARVTSCKTRMIMRGVRWSWRNHLSPFDSLRFFGRLIANKLVYRFMRDRMNKLSKTDFEAFHDYLYQILLRPGSSEYSLTYLFNLGIWAKKPLEPLLPNLETKLSFFYGSEDWTDSESAKRVSEAFPGNWNVNIIANSDHHMYFDNPDEFASLLTKESINTYD